MNGYQCLLRPGPSFIKAILIYLHLKCVVLPLLCIRPKERICVFPVTSPNLKKNRVGRSLLFLFFFPVFTKKHNKCVVCMKYIRKRGLFGAIYLQYRMDVLL